MIGLFLVLLAAQDPVVIRTVESPTAATFPARRLAAGEIGVVLGAGPQMKDLLSAAGFESPPFAREAGGRKIAFVSDVREAAAAKADLVVLVTPLGREEAAAALRETPGIALAIVTGRGGGDSEPLRIGNSWMVQAPGDPRLWGRIELRGGAVAHRLSMPDGAPSEPVAAARLKLGVPADPWKDLRESMKPAAEAALPAILETSSRACRLRIHAVSEKGSYGSRAPAPGRVFLLLDASFENLIPLTLVKSNQVPTQYQIRNLGDHLYLVVNGDRASRLLPDASSLPGHVPTANFTLERLGTRVRGNLLFEIPASGVRSLDLRLYDYAHGHLFLALRAGPAAGSKPLAPLQDNEILEAGVFRSERVPEADGRKAPEGMTYLVVELRARSMMRTEADASAFDPKAKPGQKIPVGTVSDWTEARKHLHVLLDGEWSYPAAASELGDAPRFLPDVLTGGTAAFLVPQKALSVEVRCDFPNARLPDGEIVHPKPLAFLVEGKRPAAAARPAIVEIDDDVFQLAVTGQEAVRAFAGAKPPAGSVFLRLDVTVTGAGTGGEMFQTADQLLYATEKGAQIPMHESTFAGPRAPAKLILVPTGERRSFQAVFAIPESDRRPRLAYRGVSKASIVPLKPLEAPVRACPKCKRAAEPGEKFCGECGTKLGP